MEHFKATEEKVSSKFRVATDIPTDVFSDPVVYQHELKRIFRGPYWHAIAHRAELPQPGKFLTRWFADIPLLIHHGGDGEIRVFINFCSHRGTLLEMRAHGEATEFQCPYHRWCFDECGKLSGAPSRRDFRPDFRNEDYALRQLRVEEYLGLIFVSLSEDTPDLSEYLGAMIQPLADSLLDDGDLELLGYQRTIFRTNWKIYMDNDSYHPPLLHKAFSMLGWQERGGVGKPVVSDPYGHYSIQSQNFRFTDNGFLSDPSLMEWRGQDDRMRVVCLRPLTIVTKHLDTINIRFARPVGVDGTEVCYAYFGHVSDDADYRRHRIRQSSNLLGPSGFISIEDGAIFGRAQATTAVEGYQRFVKGVGKPREDWDQNDEVTNTVWWGHYRDVMGFTA